MQGGFFDTAERLPERIRQRLEQSWAGTFYREIFCRINESRFAKLYADKPSRPNTPVNVQVGLEILKAGFGWSDEEMYDAFQFNLQVRYALGLRRVGEGGGLEVAPVLWTTKPRKEMKVDATMQGDIEFNTKEETITFLRALLMLNNRTKC